MGSRRAVLEVLASLADGADPGLPGPEQPSFERRLAHDATLRIIAGVARLNHTLDGTPATDGAVSSARVIGRIAAAEAPTSWNGLQIREKIGAGTYGDVYRAHDPRLQHDIALKLYKSGGRLSDHDVDLLLREGRALARVRHEHVVRVHGADVSEDRVGLWMELVEGQSLAALLARQGTFGASEAGAIGQDLCRALASVHQAGVIHGDIKAQNIVREAGGRHVLMDFGSWRSTEGALASTPATGTPLYLAPEVLDGHPLSVASDIYAVGVVLFHLVTRDFPVKAATVADLVAAHRDGRSANLADLRPDLPQRYVDVVHRAIDPDASRRFRTAGEMALALAAASLPAVPPPSSRRPWLWTAWLAAAVIAATLLVWLVPGGETRPTKTAAAGSVTVLPFRQVGGTGGLEFLAEAIGDDVIVQLSRLPGLRVVSSRGGSVPSGGGATGADVGRRLQVASVVMGSTHISGNDVRVFVELIDSATARQMWADTFSAERRDIAALQTRVVRGIAQVLKGRLSASEHAALGHQGMGAEAFELYLKGRYFWNKRTPDDLRASIDLFQQAIGVQPDAALAHAGLADAYLLSTVYGVLPPAEGHRLAEAAALEALRLDDSLAEACAALASTYHEQWRFAEAEPLFERSVMLNPSYASARHWRAIYLAQLGRMAEARREIDYAQSLEPWSPTIATARGVILYLARDFDAAIQQYRAVLALSPDFAAAHAALAEAYVMVRRFDEAGASLARARALAPALGRIRAIDAYIMAAAGNDAGARRILAETEAGLDRTQEGSTDIAAVYARLDDRPRATAWFERAVQARDGSMLFVNVEPRYDRLRTLVDVPAALTRGGVDQMLVGGQR